MFEDNTDPATNTVPATNSDPANDIDPSNVTYEDVILKNYKPEV